MTVQTNLISVEVQIESGAQQGNRGEVVLVMQDESGIHFLVRVKENLLWKRTEEITVPLYDNQPYFYYQNR